MKPSGSTASSAGAGAASGAAASGAAASGAAAGASASSAAFKGPALMCRSASLAASASAAAKPTEEPLKQFNVREAHCVLGRIKSAQGLHDDAVGILKPAADAEATHWRHEQGGWMRAALLVAMARQKLAAGASAEEIKPLVDEAVAICERAFRPKDEVDEARALLE